MTAPAHPPTTPQQVTPAMKSMPKPTIPVIPASEMRPPIRMAQTNLLQYKMTKVSKKDLECACARQGRLRSHRKPFVAPEGIRLAPRNKCRKCKKVAIGLSALLPSEIRIYATRRPMPTWRARRVIVRISTLAFSLNGQHIGLISVNTPQPWRLTSTTTNLRNRVIQKITL